MSEDDKCPPPSNNQFESAALPAATVSTSADATPPTTKKALNQPLSALIFTSINMGASSDKKQHLQSQTKPREEAIANDQSASRSESETKSLFSVPKQRKQLQQIVIVFGNLTMKYEEDELIDYSAAGGDNQASSLQLDFDSRRYEQLKKLHFAPPSLEPTRTENIEPSELTETGDAFVDNSINVDPKLVSCPQTLITESTNRKSPRLERSEHSRSDEGEEDHLVGRICSEKYACDKSLRQSAGNEQKDVAGLSNRDQVAPAAAAALRIPFLQYESHQSPHRFPQDDKEFNNGDYDEDCDISECSSGGGANYDNNNNNFQEEFEDNETESASYSRSSRYWSVEEQQRTRHGELRHNYRPNRSPRAMCGPRNNILHDAKEFIYNSIDLNHHDSGNVDSNQVSLSDDTSTNSQITSPILRVQSWAHHHHHNPSVSPPPQQQQQAHQKSSSSSTSNGSRSSLYDRQTATSAARSLYKHFNKSNNNSSDLMNSPNAAPSQIDYYNSYNSLSRPANGGGSRDLPIEYGEPYQLSPDQISSTPSPSCDILQDVDPSVRCGNYLYYNNNQDQQPQKFAYSNRPKNVPRAPFSNSHESQSLPNSNDLMYTDNALLSQTGENFRPYHHPTNPGSYNISQMSNYRQKYDYMPINDTYLSPINLYSRPNASAHHHHHHPHTSSSSSATSTSSSSSNNKSQSRQFLATTLSSLASSGGLKKKGHDANHVKKPLNAFMIFMKEQRQKYIDQYEVKQSALINQIMAKDWKQMSEADQKPYYDKAKEQRKLHKQMYPDQYSTPSGKKKSSAANSGKNSSNPSSPDTAIELLRDQHKKKLKSLSNNSGSSFTLAGTETNYNYPVPSSTYNYGPSWMQYGESPIDIAPTAPMNYYQHNLRQNAMFHSITSAAGKNSISKDTLSDPWQQHGGAIMGPGGSGSRLSNFEPNCWPYSPLTSIPSEYGDPSKSDYSHQNFYRSPMPNSAAAFSDPSASSRCTYISSKNSEHQKLPQIQQSSAGKKRKQCQIKCITTLGVEKLSEWCAICLSRRRVVQYAEIVNRYNASSTATTTTATAANLSSNSANSDSLADSSLNIRPETSKNDNSTTNSSTGTNSSQDNTTTASDKSLKTT